MKNFLDLNSVMFNNATEWIEQTSFNWKLCLIHNTVFSDTFFVQVTRALSVGNLSNVHRACSFFTISDPFCIDNARVIGRKIRYIYTYIYHLTTRNVFNHRVTISFKISSVTSFTYKLTDEAAIEQRNYTQQLRGSTWFVRTGIMFSLKTVHMYRTV